MKKKEIVVNDNMKNIYLILNNKKMIKYLYFKYNNII